MTDLAAARARFLKDPPATRLGNLASDLLRLSTWVTVRRPDARVIDLMTQVASMLEWTGDLASEELADMQREICRWRRIWPDEKARSLLILRARQRADRAVEMSGIYT